MNRKINEVQVPTTKDFVVAMINVISEAKKHLLASQQRHKFFVDTKQCDVSYEVEFEVLLSISKIKLKALNVRKLLP